MHMAKVHQARIAIHRSAMTAITSPPSRHIHRRHRPRRPWHEMWLGGAHHGEGHDRGNEDGEAADPRKLEPKRWRRCDTLHTGSNVGEWTDGPLPTRTELHFNFNIGGHRRCESSLLS